MGNKCKLDIIRALLLLISAAAMSGSGTLMSSSLPV